MKRKNYLVVFKKKNKGPEGPLLLKNDCLIIDKLDLPRSL